MISWKIIGFLAILLGADLTASQSNYALQALDVEYGNGLPQTATLDGKVTELDTLQPQINLNRTSAALNCAAGSMHIQMKFKEPFYGIAYSDFDRNSACFTKGSGDVTATLEFPLKGCGTKQEPARVFTNNVIVRFHPGLEMEGDEVITVVCRYPPPIVPAPPLQRINLPPPAAPILAPKPLKEFEVLMIICTLLFLGLMLLGLGCSAFCLKQRNIQVIRKRPFSPMEEDSEKVSTIESFSQLKIPRVQAPSSSSSEVPLEENLASDYPSSLEEMPQRPETVSSEYSDTHVQVETETVSAAVLAKPKFEVNMRVAQQPLEHMAYAETEGSITSIETAAASEITIPELHPPPRRQAPPPPVFRQVQDVHVPQRHVQNTEYIDTLTVVDREEVDTATHYMQPLALKTPEVSVHTVDDVYLQTIVERRLIEDEERRTRETTQFYKKEQPRWDVQIRTHQADEDDNWERGSETTEVSSIGWSTVEEPQIHPNYTTINREHLIRRNEVHREETDRVMVSRAMQKLQQDDTRIWNEKWSVLLRVLESPPPGDYRPDTDDESDVASVLTVDDKEKWRQIISTESTLRTLLTQATYREDYERIRRDTRYEKLFEPEKWDVIIHVLAPPQQSTDHEDRFYSDSTSEVSSSSFGSSSPLKPSRMYRKKSSDTNVTESKSITDVRSMTEMMVDFGEPMMGGDDTSSEISSVPGAARSIADRSSTEIIEFAPLEEEDEDIGNIGMGSTNLFSRTERRVMQQTTGTTGGSSSSTGFMQQVQSSSSTGYVQQVQQAQSSSSSKTLFSTRRQLQ